MCRVIESNSGDCTTSRPVFPFEPSHASGSFRNNAIQTTSGCKYGFGGRLPRGELSECVICGALTSQASNVCLFQQAAKDGACRTPGRRPWPAPPSPAPARWRSTPPRVPTNRIASSTPSCQIDPRLHRRSNLPQPRRPERPIRFPDRDHAHNRK